MRKCSLPSRIHALPLQSPHDCVGPARSCESELGWPSCELGVGQLGFWLADMPDATRLARVKYALCTWEKLFDQLGPLAEGAYALSSNLRQHIRYHLHYNVATIAVTIVTPQIHVR